MADHSWALPVRIATASLAIACTLAIVFAVFATAYFKGLEDGGHLMMNVLVAPLAFVFYAGPPLLATSMASRARSMFPALVALALAVTIAGLFVALGAAPWEFGHWRRSPGEAGMNLLIGMIFGVWPVTAGAGVLWLVVNRRRE